MTSAPPPPSAPPLALLRLHLQGNTFTHLIPPRVVINGAAQTVHFGVNEIQIYAGPTYLHCEVQWLRTYGQADLAFTAAPGTATDVWYVAPYHQFTTGSIGYEKQRARGTGFIVGLVVIMVLLVAVIILAG
ncbi:hypothetical protein [Nocardioides sp.]|uniref:hypothetical protein n=1 Tax=Nocardioides sp. TaxID=35761 RepID=UPI003510EF0B